MLKFLNILKRHFLALILVYGTRGNIAIMFLTLTHFIFYVLTLSHAYLLSSIPSLILFLYSFLPQHIDFGLIDEIHWKTLAAIMKAFSSVM